MNNGLKIKCPKCKKTFDASTAFEAHFKNIEFENTKKIEQIQKLAVQEAEKKYKSQIENQKEEVEKAKKEAIAKATKETNEKYKSQIENYTIEVENAKKEAFLNAEKLVSEKFKAQIKEKDEQIEKNKKELELKIRQELKDKIEISKQETVQRAEEQAEKKYKAIIEKEKEEKEIIKKSQEITQRRLEERTQEINQIMQDRKVELQGEVQEERIQDYLRKVFPEDNVEEIKKGARGGDCILTINDREKKNIAKIYFESKDTKAFQEKWVDKLLNDMKDKGIANGVMIVSKSALPPDFNEFGGYVERYGNTITIIPLVFPIIHAIVSKIRSILIYKSRENNNHQVPLLMKKAWENLQSPNFILPVKSMLAQVNAMEILFKKEKESIQRFSANKERNIKAIYDNIVTMINSFYINVGDIFPKDLMSDDNLLEDNPVIEITERKKEINNKNVKKVNAIGPNISKDILDIAKINIHDEWSLSIKAFSVLKDLDIIFVGDLIAYSEADLLKSRNFGKKSLEELEHHMQKYSLSFETSIDNWEIIREDLINY